MLLGSTALLMVLFSLLTTGSRSSTRNFVYPGLQHILLLRIQSAHELIDDLASVFRFEM